MPKRETIELDDYNEVQLRGRLAAQAEERTLPSGDVLTTFRVVVGRSESDRRPSIDTLDCVAWRRDVQRSAAAWEPGDIVEISGALRRRFWRAANGPASRTEVEVLRAKRVKKAS